MAHALRIALATSILLAASAARAAVPVVFACNGDDLVKAKEAFKAGDKPTVEYIKKVVARADKELANPPYSVMNKASTPPSGDKHDYMSLSPYWWPDPAKPDGKPYIRKDGEFNPERLTYDIDNIEKFSTAVDDLSMAYYFTSDEKYAAKCAEFIRAWCVSPATRMNPSLRYGQFVPGYDEARPSGIIEGGRMKKAVDAVGLIAGSPSWTSDDDAATKAWFKQLMTYIRTSPQGKKELSQPNNHGTWSHVQAGTYALFIGDTAAAKELVDDEFKRRIDSQIKPDGSQPEELVRTTSFHYSRFNVVALMDMATLGDHLGLDLWNFKTPDGRSLRSAIDFLIPYALGEKKWKWEQIRDVNFSGEMSIVLRRAANAYHDPKYEEAAQKLMKKEPQQEVEILHPSKL